MLAPYRPQFIEKILTDSFGRQFRVVFAVSFMDGEIRGRIVSAVEIKALDTHALCLPCVSAKPSPYSILLTPCVSVVSPYIELYFFNSQPTRAPSHN